MVYSSPTAPIFLSHDSPEYVNMNEIEEHEYYQRIYDSLDPLQQKFLASHTADVKASARSREPSYSYLDNIPFFSVFSSSIRLLNHIILSVLSNPLGPIINFTDSFYSLLCFTLIYFALYFFQAFLVFCKLCGLEKYITSTCQKFLGGYGTVTWDDSTMFDNKAQVIQAARSFLSSRLGEPAEAATAPIELNFCVEVAQTILLMSSILYERDEEFVERAFESTDDVRLNLLRSEEKMLKAAADWNCQFTSIADFQTAKGPFVGAFFDLEARPNPFMIIVFKGTSFEDISEWIVDTNFKLESCADQLGAGFAHQGFYSSLFPSPCPQETPSPYLRIIETIRSVAMHVNKEAGIPMNLFVGGHSLGAAIASLFYARLIESPEDLGPHTILRDAYCYGTPRGCDSLLASRVEYNLAKPVNFQRSLWRVSNHSASVKLGDVVSHLPPGMADRRSTRSVIKLGSLLSYAAIGTPIDLEPRGSSPYYKFKSVRCGTKLKVLRLSKDSNQPEPIHQIDHLDETFSPLTTLDPLFWLNLIFITFAPFIHDHLPGGYLTSLNKILTTREDILKEEK